jgi:hypothetical protein
LPVSSKSPEAASPIAEQRREKETLDRRLIRLWIVVTAFWTIATLFRIERLWLPRVGWHGILDGPWLWLSLGLPPLVFALLLAYVRQLAHFRRFASPRKF